MDLFFTKANSSWIKWYRRAAEQGFAAAQTNLGFMYTNGRGVAQSDTEAFKWYRRAADQGFAIAQSNLGFMYANGRGVPKDLTQAYMWAAATTWRSNWSPWRWFWSW